MVRLWGDTPETEELAKKNLEKQLEKILLEKGKINIQEIFEKYWNNHNLLNHYLQIYLMIDQLADEGKIIIDEDKNISLAKVTFLDYDEIKEVTIWDLEHKKEDIKKKKEIIERYQTINFYV